MMEEFSTEQEACDRCGRNALGILGEEHLCENCLHEVSGCCGEIGRISPIRPI